MDAELVNFISLQEMIEVFASFGIETKDTSWVNMRQVAAKLLEQRSCIAELKEIVSNMECEAEVQQCGYDESIRSLRRCIAELEAKLRLCNDAKRQVE